MYEQSSTEFGGKKAGITRKEVSEIIQNKIMQGESEKHREELARLNRSKYGTGRYIIPGRDDRMEGKPYDDSMYLSEADKQSYRHGYYNMGNTCLFALIAAGKYDNYIPETPEELNERIAKIATNDGMNPEILFEGFNDTIKNNQVYREYYNAAYLSRNNKTR